MMLYGAGENRCVSMFIRISIMRMNGITFYQIYYIFPLWPVITENTSATKAIITKT